MSLRENTRPRAARRRRPRRPSAASLGLCAEQLESRRLLAIPAAVEPAGATSPEGAALLTDINRNTKDSRPLPFAESGGQVFFAAETYEAGRELWVTTGAAGGGAPSGARLFADVSPGPRSSDPRGVAALGARAVFWADDASGADRVWSSDGTTAGTQVLLPGFSLASGANDRIFTAGGRAYFVATDGDPGGPSPTGRLGIYSTDGTPGGTRLEQAAPRVTEFALHAGDVYYATGPADVQGSGPLYRLNAGTAPGSGPVQLTPDGVAVHSPLISLGDTLLFNGATPATSSRIWRTDGTPAGTRQLTDQQLTTNGSDLRGAARLSNGRIILLVGSQQRLFALNTDGGVAPIGGHQSSNVVTVGNAAYFIGSDSNDPRLAALWRTDGTATGTRHVKSLPATTAVQPPRSEADKLTAVGNRLLFRGRSVEGWELWGSDSTADGTALVKDINPGPDSGHPVPGYTAFSTATAPSYFVAGGGRAFFAATSRDAGTELWSSDGTAAGTARVADVNASTSDAFAPEHVPPFTRPQDNGVEFNGRTYFAADDGVHGTELWSTDGTAAGTRMEADLVPGAQPSGPVGFLVHDNALWFVTVFNRIYRSNGTAAGTTQVTSSLGPVGLINREINHPLFVYKGKVSFFGGYGGDVSRQSGAYLWSTDGTPAGTVPLGTSISRDTRASLEEPTVSGNYVYFRWSGDQAGWQSLYRHDGVEARRVDAAVHPYRLTDVNGTLVYTAEVSDPQLRGLRAVGPIGFPYRLPAAEGVRSIVRLGNVAYVTGWASTPQYHDALWRTDGTWPGTVEVTELPEAAGWDMNAAAGRLWFFGRPSRLSPGPEPWVSDGTAAGTRSLGDLNPGEAPSWRGAPHFAAGPDGYVYFRADTADTGVELFRSDGTSQGTGLAADFIPGPGDSFPGPSMTAGGDLFFVADSVRYGREWWRIDPAPPRASVVVARHAFYNNSAFDGNDAAGNAADDGAIATDKNALLAGQDRLPGFDNVTSFSRGINGVIIDIENLPIIDAFLDARDFDFGGAPAPVSVTVRPGAGAGGSDRVTLVWRDYNPRDTSPLPQAVANGWLTITVKANGHTGLSQPDTFSFGNLIGETGDAFSRFRVSTIDALQTRRNFFSAAPVTSRYDFNRDGRVGVTDFAIARSNLGRTLASPNVPVGPPPSLAPAAAHAEERDGVWDRVIAADAL